jgi:hypothetical protein
MKFSHPGRARCSPAVAIVTLLATDHADRVRVTAFHDPGASRGGKCDAFRSGIMGNQGALKIKTAY